MKIHPLLKSISLHFHPDELFPIIIHDQRFIMIRGERFEIDLDADELTPAAPTVLPASFVGDVLERGAPKAAVAPTLKPQNDGFPGHTRRKVESRFKKAAVQNQASSQQRIHSTVSPSAGPASAAITSKSWEEEEKRRIDEENRQKLADMTPDQIEQERQELLSSLSPAFVQRLMQRANRDSGEQAQQLLRQANIDDGSNEDRLGDDHTTLEAQPTASNKSVSFAEPESTAEDEPADALIPHDSIHFPRPPQPPSLDPSSDTFLTDLHQKYFPELPADPEKLEWMQSSSSTSSYDPSATALKPEHLRFSFTGELIPPRTSAEIPVTAGLHHHGDAPESAGYTIPELAHLSRSSYAAQRCIAFQTLGRILYRLGIGEFGNSGEPGAELVGEEAAQDTFGALARGLWSVMDREQVVELLVLESEGKGVDKGRHQSAKAYATEAVWLWRKGGGRTWHAG